MPRKNAPKTSWPLAPIGDIEHAIGSGEVVRIRKDDPRGNVYVVNGAAADGRRLELWADSRVATGS